MLAYDLNLGRKVKYQEIRQKYGYYYCFSNLTLNKGIYFLKVTLNKTELPNAGQNALFLAGLKVFKFSNSS